MTQHEIAGILHKLPVHLGQLVLGAEIAVQVFGSPG